MSLQDLGKDDISEETHHLLDRIASKDSENAGLRSQLLRREADLNDLRAALDETINKLRTEADRALQFEAELARKSEEFKNEKNTSQNVASALRLAQERLQSERNEARTLEATLDTMTLESNSARSQRQALESENRALQQRVLEMENNLRNLATQPPPSQIPKRGHRPRSSSVTDFRNPNMEKELSDARLMLVQKDKQLQSLEDKVTQLNAQLIHAENGRVAGERSTQAELRELRATLEEKERELESLRSNDAATREEELLARIDEDEAKIAALELQLRQVQVPQASQKEFGKLQAQLSDEKKKSARLESERLEIQEQKEELLKEKGVLSEELAQTSQQLASLQGQAAASQRDAAPYPTLANTSAGANDNEYAEQLQNLLIAVARLREERDGLKRTAGFLETESRIAMEGLRAQTAKCTPSVPGEVTHDKCHQAIRRLDLVLQTLTITTDYFQDQYVSSCKDLEAVQNRILMERTSIQAAKAELEGRQNEKVSLQGHLDRAVQDLAAFTTERDALELSMSTRLQFTSEELSLARSSHRTTQLELSALSKNYASLESERNALNLQVANLQADLSSAQSELNTVEQKYTALQAQRLVHMPSSQATQSLRNQIEELEGRVDRRTEQIGILQHDMRRLQTNLQLQEDRVLELTAERDTLTCEKEAMVDDCAEARDARDLALKKLEAVEEEIEKLEERLNKSDEAHSHELASVVEVLMKQRSAFLTRRSSLERTIHQQVDFSHVDKAQIAHLEELNVHLTNKVQMFDRMPMQSLQDDTLDDDSSSLYNPRDWCIALSVSQLAFRRNLRQLSVSEQNVSSLRGQLSTLQSHLNRTASDLDESETRITELESTIATERTKAAADATSKDERHRYQFKMLQQELEVLRSNEDAELRLQDLQSLHDTQVTALQKQLDTITHERDDHIDTTASQLKRISELEAELAHAQFNEAETLVSVRDELAVAQEQLQHARADVARSEALREEMVDRIAELKEEHKLDLSKMEDEMQFARVGHQDALAALKDTLNAQEAQLKSRIDQLQEELSLHSQSKAHYTTELAQAQQRADGAEVLVQELRQNLDDIVQQLEAAQKEASALQEEKQSLQENMTELEAEIQRLLSLTQSLEIRVTDSATKIATLTGRLDSTRAELVESQRAAKAAEINLSLHGVENQKLISSLRRELDSLRSQPDFSDVVEELEAKNSELDELLKQKCAEIEDFDERMLEQLKTNKKLTAKLESLTRKTQSLQTRLSSAKAAVPISNQPSSSEPASAQKVVPATTFTAPSSTSQPGRAHAASGSSYRQSFHPTTASLRQPSPASCERSTYAPASAHMTCEKTPERRRLGPHQTEVLDHDEAQVLTSAGRKRRAPDDDDRDAVPVEGRYGSADTGTTPRQRRALYSAQSGFTPVRSSAPRTSLRHLSPSKNKPQLQGISDVTNSPRAKSARLDDDASLGKKRSWLGKIRGGTVPLSDSRGLPPTRTHVFQHNPS